VVEGEKMLWDALNSGAEVESLFVAAGSTDSAAVARLAAGASERGVRVFELAAGVLERVADTVTPQPVLGVVRVPKASLDELREASFVVVCVDVRDPGNAGAVVRAADAAGADGVVFCAGNVDPFNPKAVRGSAGSVLHLPVVHGGAATEVLQSLGEYGLRRVGTVASGGRPHTEADLSERVAVVLGNEASGLPGSLSPHLDDLVEIPMSGGAESLNVAMAAAVILFEVVRQRSGQRALSMSGSQSKVAERA
jgi:TrmH family RNA methyltransferase